jgi:predicted nucleotidyltransferase
MQLKSTSIIPKQISKKQASIIYANEADVLNVALFGKTAKEWREENPELEGNIRDHAHLNELICLSNLENINALFINEEINQSERLIKLNQIAIKQIKLLKTVGIGPKIE